MESAWIRFTRSALVVLLGSMVTSCVGVVAQDEQADVAVFGAPGSFGRLGNRLSTGQSLAKVAVPNFETRPGQSFFFPALASDGTLFIANMTQAYAESALTGCEMVVTCFNPEQPTCYDDRMGIPAHFSNIRIPAASGSLSTPSECPNGLHSEVPEVFGGEIDDLEVVVDEQHVERVVFDSFNGSGDVPPPPNNYPMFGSLWKQDGAWRVDSSSLRYPRDLTDSTSQGPAACPRGHCGAVTEMARLPASNRLVINQYIGEVVMVVDLQGQVLGSYEVDSPRDWCDPTQTEPIIASFRQVNPDPTSVLGDERFVVVYEGWGPTGQIAQEFSYNELEPDLSRRVRPITAPFHPNSPFHPAPTCGHGSTVLSATYDDLGNLWLTAMDRDGKWQTASLVVVKGEGRRRLDQECSFLDPATGQPRPWGTVCETDFDVGALVGRMPQVAWRFPSALNDPIVDHDAGSVYAVLSGGLVYPIARKALSDGGLVFVVTNPLNPNLKRLAPLETHANRRFVVRGAIDSARRSLWLPVATTIAYDGLASDFYVGQQFNQYIYRIDLDEAFADNLVVHDVVAPSSAASGAELALTVRATVPEFKSAPSFLALYPPGSAVPLATAAWTQDECEQALCRYSTRIAAGTTAGQPGVYSWHAGFFGGTKRAHLIGRIVVD
jgi:hypothetical protein